MRTAKWIWVMAPLAFGCQEQAGPQQQSAAVPAPLVDGVVRTSARLPASVDGCLDQSVKDLGVGAKKAPEGRAWTVGPEKIHAALVGKGGARIAASVAPEAADVTVEATWKGPLEGEHRVELERRLKDMTARIGFFCGQMKTAVECQSGTAAALAPCSAG